MMSFPKSCHLRFPKASSPSDFPVMWYDYLYPLVI